MKPKTTFRVGDRIRPLYLAEFDHRYNERGVTDGERTVSGLMKVEGKRLTYHQRRTSKSSGNP